MREYSVTYTTKDGERRMETMAGSGHRDIERKIAAIGGTILDLDRAEDDYSLKSRRSLRRTIGCSTLVILLIALAVVLYWLKFHR